jgi:rhamnogalacturonyl hydrolase YesR
LLSVCVPLSLYMREKWKWLYGALLYGVARRYRYRYFVV